MTRRAVAVAAGAAVLLALPPTGSKQVTLPTLLHVQWERLPDLPSNTTPGACPASGGGFQDSDGGFIGNRTFVTAFGYRGCGTPGFLNFGWALDLDGGTGGGWTQLPPAPISPRQEVAAARIGDALFYVGGFSYTFPYTFADGAKLSRDGSQWRWDKLPPLPWPVASIGVAAIGTRLYALGGVQYDSKSWFTWDAAPLFNLSVPFIGGRLLELDTSRFSGGSTAWVERAPLPGTPRWCHATVAHADSLYVFGGISGTDAPAPGRGGTHGVVDAWRWAQSTNKWEALAPLPTSSANFPGGNIVFQDRYVLLVGGGGPRDVVDRAGKLFPVQGARPPTFICPPDKTVQREFCHPRSCAASAQVSSAEYFNDIFVYDLASATWGLATGTSPDDPGLVLPDCGPLPMNVNLGQTEIDGDTIVTVGGECDGRNISGQMYGHYPQLAIRGTLKASTVSIGSQWLETSRSHNVAEAAALKSDDRAVDTAEHLFVDDPTPASSGLTLTMHPPAKAEMLLVPDKPWEQIMWWYTTILKVSETDYRLYYDTDGPSGRFLCVALSPDGVNWTKPELDIVSFYDNTTGINHTRTNILNTRRSGTTFIDTNPKAPASQRFKTIIPGGTVYSSADGFRWEVLTEGHIPYSDTQPVAFYDHDLGKYRVYMRNHDGRSSTGQSKCIGGDRVGRSVGLLLVDDLAAKVWGPWDRKEGNTTIFKADAQDPPCMDVCECMLCHLNCYHAINWQLTAPTYCYRYQHVHSRCRRAFHFSNYVSTLHKSPQCTFQWYQTREVRLQFRQLCSAGILRTLSDRRRLR